MSDTYFINHAINTNSSFDQTDLPEEVNAQAILSKNDFVTCNSYGRLRMNIDDLANKVHEYEKTYGLESHIFYDLYKKNYLKISKDFVDWAILYKKLFLNKND